jgi:L-asparaginase / beta-aspartyl-peptidase
MPGRTGSLAMRPSMMVHGGAGSGRYSKEDRRFGELLRAVEAGMEAIRSGSATEGVLAAVGYMEESGAFNCGRGACLTAEGGVELDAAVMSGRGLGGAGVGAVTCTYHPVYLARWVMENTPHVLLVGERCGDYAKLAGMKVERLLPSKAARTKYATLRAKGGRNLELLSKMQEGNTVGAVALGSDGVPAAAVSTGGMWLKLPGRVGDSAIVGAGIYADAKSGAACATGTGEEIIRLGLSMRACELMRSRGAADAARGAVSTMSRARGRGTAGVITVDLEGRVGASYNTEAMGRAWYDPAKGKAYARI